MGRTIVFAALTLILVAPALIAEEKSLIGQNVYPRTTSILVTRGHETLATGADLTFPIVVLRQAPDAMTIWVAKARQEGQVRRQDVLTATEAIPVFSQRMRENPNNLYAAFVLSLAWEDLGNLDQALGVISQVLLTEPNPILYNRRGNLWQRKREFDRAIQDYDKSLKLDATSVSCLFNRGLAWSYLGNDEKAISDYNQVLKSSPLNSSTYVARASCWKGLGELDQAMSDYTLAIVLNSQDFLPFQERAALWYRKGEYLKALADYNQVVSLQSQKAKAPAYLNRGLVWVKLGLYGEALADFDRAIQLDRRNATAYNNRGWVRATCPDKSYRNGKLALADAKTACELAHWNNPHHLSTLGEASAELGDFPSAIRWQEQAAKLQSLQKPGDLEFQAGSKERLECYKAGRPFRESSPNPLSK